MKEWQRELLEGNNKIRVIQLMPQTHTAIFYRARTEHQYQLTRSSRIRLDIALYNLALKRGESLPGYSDLVDGLLIYSWDVYFPNE